MRVHESPWEAMRGWVLKRQLESVNKILPWESMRGHERWRFGVWCTFSEGTNSTNSHGLSWTLMAALTLMDSHGRILWKDSSCLSKTPPLMDSHGLSWLDFIYRLKLSFQNSTSSGLSWTLATPNNCRKIDILNSDRLERRPLMPIKAEIVATRSLPLNHLTATDCNAAARANSFVCLQYKTSWGWAACLTKFSI